MHKHSSLSSHMGILRFWHKVEFFLPFDLTQQVLDAKDSEWSVQRFSTLRLQGMVDSEGLWCVPPPPEREITGYEVYLGVFDKSELTKTAHEVVREALAPNEELDEIERGGLEGWTCFARVMVSPQGRLLPTDVAVSTAPWAIGCIKKHSLQGLDFDRFQDAKQALITLFETFRATLLRRARERRLAREEPLNADEGADLDPLTPSDLMSLVELFYGWAGYHPSPMCEDAPVLVIRAQSCKRRKKTNDSPDSSEPATGDEDDDSDVDSAPENELRVEILNSFYIEDLERVLLSVGKGEASPVLQAYLTPVPIKERQDLYEPDGRNRILSALAPDRWPLSHWPDEPQHAMSLMQQFSINRIFECLKTQGLFSVNGPPGTGKTTLLRDLIAENITQRARALAQFESAKDAFETEPCVLHFDASAPTRLAVLREELTGYEMVVASSNNAAVENLSRDLPKTRALGKAQWRDKQGKPNITYLQPVAHKIAAQTDRGEYVRLSSEDEPWGLVSCALGRKANRNKLATRLAFPGNKLPDCLPKGFDPERHQSIWMWRDRYTGPTYGEARQAFLEADQRVQHRFEELSRYADLLGLSHASFLATSIQREQEAQRALQAAEDACTQAREELRRCERSLERLRSEEVLIVKGRPSWWERLFHRPSYRTYSREMAENTRNQREALRKSYAVEDTCSKAEKDRQHAAVHHAEAVMAIERRKNEWAELEKERAGLAHRFPEAKRPEHADDLEDPVWQIQGLWKDTTLNRLRSELFAASLVLHEAWLVEGLRKGGRFGPNLVALCDMLRGKMPAEKDKVVHLWQSLFMVIPVVSSTFASFARQFQDLGPNSIGWLFIDEAGQAVPQAAVGAIWRARRAVVVGDPLQIEPVFTVPIKLVEALARDAQISPDIEVMPHRVSVQNLADAANPDGADVGLQDIAQWIGSPLRVHRRCVDPMFSIANTIAYNGKMVFFEQLDARKRLPPPESLDLGSSAWVHVTGPTASKQAVPKQIDLVRRALEALYQRLGDLPPIYIITPFRRVKSELIAHVMGEGQRNTTPLIPNKQKLRAWCNERIGTIHTFQGKEESIVWMVLGCDENTRGAAVWAASKPNLLNVAVTRARHRFFMIGDPRVWGDLSNFDVALRALQPCLSPDEFLERMQAAASLTAAQSH